MLLETFQDFPDFELLDSGEGFRLERWGQVVLQRPDPQIIWQKSLPKSEWDKAWAVFKSPSGEDRGKWAVRQAVLDPWIVEFKQTKFLLKLSPFKHTGLFAEQAANWEWMLDELSSLSSSKVMKERGESLKDLQLDNFKLASKFRVLNLFAYTGGATMVLAGAGCHVTHVDASKPAITWANENHRLNKLPDNCVRWMLDDCVKFVKRELKRGATYDGIIMDPPAFGHSPTGKTWKFNQDLPGLLADCVQLLSENAKFLIVNGYATNSSALALHNVLQDSLKGKQGSLEFGELCLKQKSGRLLSTGIFARWANLT